MFRRSGIQGNVQPQPGRQGLSLPDKLVLFSTDISDPNTPADQTDSTGQEAQTGEKNSILPVVAVVASVLLGGGAFYFIKRRR